MDIKSNKKHKRYNTKKTTKELSVKVLDQDQINLISEIKDNRDKYLMILLLNTGLRVSELVDLNYNDCFSDMKTKKFRNALIITGKGNKKREVPLNNDAKKAILEIHRYNKKVFKIVKTNKYSPLLISRLGNRITTRAVYNITMKIKANPHSFRHTFGTALAKNNKRIEVIASILGHSSTDITNKYYIEKTIEDKIDAVNSVMLMPEKGLKVIENKKHSIKDVKAS